MSNETGLSPGVADDVRPEGAAPFSSSSGLLRAAVPQSASQTDQLAAFVQQQPMTAALVALVIGYVIGKIS